MFEVSNSRKCRKLFSRNIKHFPLQETQRKIRGNEITMTELRATMMVPLAECDIVMAASGVNGVC